MLSHDRAAWSFSRPAFRRRQTLASFPSPAGLTLAEEGPRGGGTGTICFAGGASVYQPLLSSQADDNKFSSSSRNDEQHQQHRPTRCASSRQRASVRSPTTPSSLSVDQAGTSADTSSRASGAELAAGHGPASGAKMRRSQGRLSGEGGGGCYGVGGPLGGGGLGGFGMGVMCGGATGGSGHRKLGRTPSSPSVLFSRVKERIREKVFETSAEWPHMAAIERERRQRAAQAFELSLRGRRLSGRHSSGAGSGGGGAAGGPRYLVHQPGSLTGSFGSGGQLQQGSIGQQTASRQQSVASSGGCSDDGLGLVVVGDGLERSGGAGGGPEEKRRVRIRSDPSRRSVASDSRDDEESIRKSFDKDSARNAFRRRSISEDTYNRAPQQHSTASSTALSASGGGVGGGSSSSTRGSGVVCSNDDLKAIVHQHKLRRSPVVSPTVAAMPPLPTLDRGAASLVSLGADDLTVHHVLSSSAASSWSVEAPTSTSAAAVVWTDAGRRPLSLPASTAATTASSSMSSTNCATSATAAVVVVDLCAPPTLPQVCSSSNCRFDVHGMTPTIQEQDSLELGSSGNITASGDSGGDRGTSTCTTSGTMTSTRAAPPPTVPDVVFDEHGQTWDVYGAEFDPEILGQAIQSYLEKIIRRKKLQLSANESLTTPGDDDNDDVRDDVDNNRKITAENNDDVLPSPSCPYGTSRGGGGPRTQIDRAFRFVLRYLCSSAWRRHSRETPRTRDIAINR